jgi:hypothetical protein
MSQTLAFVYKWTHLPTMMWYVGSRTAEGCNPNDGYLCSSDTVKPMIVESNSEWKREIIATGTPEEMYQLETEILQLFDARKDTRSFNGHNNDGKFTALGNPNGNCGAPKGSTPWNKGLSVATGSMASRSPNKSHRSDKGTTKPHQQGNASIAYYGYYVSPLNEKFVSAITAGLQHNVSHSTILRWSKNNKNGWKFIPKTLVATEKNVQLNKGETNV